MLEWMGQGLHKVVGTLTTLAVLEHRTVGNHRETPSTAFVKPYNFSWAEDELAVLCVQVLLEGFGFFERCRHQHS